MHDQSPDGGPPAPEFNIFDCAALTPTEYSEKIYEAVVNIRKSRDFIKFQETASKIRQTYAYKDFLTSCRNLYKRDELETKTSELLDCAERILKDRGYT